MGTSGGLSLIREAFPEGLEVGDFIQLNSHFGDIFFETTAVHKPVDYGSGRRYWSIYFVSYDKYAAKPRQEWANSGSSGVRKVVKAAGAREFFRERFLRFQAVDGQYDPCYGFAPVGTPLRTR